MRKFNLFNHSSGQEERQITTSCLSLYSDLPLTCPLQSLHKMLILCMLLFVFGGMNVLGATNSYTPIKSISSLSNGDKVVIATMSGTSPSNGVTGWNSSKDATVSTTESNWVQYTVGSASASGWTLYDGTAKKYIASPGSSNQFLYGTTGGTCSVNGDGVLVCNSRYLCKNGSYYRMYGSIEKTYTPFYVWKVTASCSTKPTVGSSLTSVSSTVNSITATVPISAIGGCDVTENGLVYSTTNSTPTIGGTGCTKVTVTACGNTAANKTVTISDLTCGTSYYVRGYATNDAGTSYTNVKTQSTSACPLYTVTLKDDETGLTQASAGASVTLPSRAGCAGYTFAGWTKTWVAPQSSWTTTAPTIIPAGSYTPTANENLYPVYTKTEGGGTTPTNKSITFGTSYASNQSSLQSVTIYTGITATATNGTSTNPTYYTTSPGTWRIYKGSELTISSSIGKITSIVFTKSSDFDMSVKSGSLGTLSSTTWSYNDGANSVTFNVGGTTKLSAIQVTYLAPSSTTSYISVPNCCTPLAQVEGSDIVSQIARESATVSWQAVANASGYEYKLGNGDWTPATVSDLANPSFNLTGLSGATSYSINLRATGTGNYCSEGPALDNAVEFKTLSRVTAAVNYNERGAAKVSTDNENWYASVDAADGTTIYLQATPSSASWILGNWDASDGDVANNELTNWSGDVTVTANFAAAELPTLATPTDMSSSEVTAISATISWTTVANASSYAVSCTPSATQGDITVTDGVCSCTLTGLTAGTAYTWNVQAIGDNFSYKSGAACANQNFTTEVKKPTLVEITTNPTKTTYNSGEKFNAEGLVVKVTYNNGDIDAAYTGYTLSPTTDDVLTPANNKVTVSATLNEVTASADIDIVVNAKLTWKAAGADDVETYASAGKVVLPGSNPSAPDCLGEFDTFQGWSADAIATSVDVEPSYVTAETNVTADATYYAVFARMENGGTKDASSTFIVKTSSDPSSPYVAEDGATWTYNTSDGLNFENGANAGFVKSKSGWIQVELPSSATEAVSFVVTKTSNAWSGDAAASLTSGSTNIATINNAGGRSYTFTNSDKGFGTYKLTNVSSTMKACYIDYITINYKKVGKVPAEWATTCCTEWDAPAISYDVPSGWKNGDDALAVAIASGATHGDVSYASSNTDVLTVAANGTITAVGPGTAKVTATWAGGLDNEVKYCEALSESATITVTGTVTIHFDGNGATSGSMSDQVATYNVAEALTANGFEKTGYTFYGWADTQEKANAGTRDYTNQESVAFLANTTLYAVWTINSHAVTLTQPTGNTITATGAANLASVAYGTEITLSAEENDGYVFTGWDVTGATVVDANAKSTTFTMPDNDVVVSANYSTYNWISTGYSVTTDPKVAYTKVEKFSTAGVVIKENFKRSDNESLTKQEVYEGAWTAKLNGEAIANGADLAVGDYTLTLYIGGTQIASYDLTVSDIDTDVFVVGIWDIAAPAIQTGNYTMPSLSNQTAGDAATCKDHNIFVGWVEEANADEPTDENIIAGGQTGMTASNKTYYAVWAKQVTGPREFSIKYDWEGTSAGWTVNSITDGGDYGKTSGGNIVTTTTYASPKSISAKLSKSSGNTSSSFSFEYGNSSWDNIATISFGDITKHEWGNYSYNLTDSKYQNKKFRISMSGSAQSGLIDEVILVYEQDATYNTDYITDCVTRYEISYNANGGEGSYESVKKKAGATITLPDGEALSKEHHDFAGWKANNAGELLNGGSEFTVGTADVAFYAQWNEWSKTTVTFKNGEETVGTPETVYRGENYTTPAAPVVEGKLFQGWNDGENTYAAETEVAVPNDLTENITITYNALWKDILPIPEAPAITAADLANGEWVLVTANNQIKEGDVVIVAKAAELNATSTIAMGNQHTDGSKVWREYESVEKSGNKITPTVNVPMLFVQVGYGDNQYALYAINGTIGYLYDPQSSGNHYLNTGANLTTAASWTIAINANNEAEITNGASSKVLRYNAQNPRFSCYANGQQAVALYKWVKKISGDMDISDVTLTDAVIVEDGATLTIDEAATLDNLTVEAGGKVDGSGNLTVNDFTIEGQDGKSGQVMNAHKLTINGDAYFDFTLAVSGTKAANQWHNFSVPFPVSVMDGVYNAETGAKLTNEVDYAIEDYHGDLRAQGKYGWKKYRGIMQPGITYSMTVNGDIQTFRFKKVAGAYSFDANPSVGFSQYNSGENTNAGWNGLGNMRLCYASVNNENIKENSGVRYVQILDATEYAYKSYTVEEINLTVGSAFFIQAANNGTMTFAAAHDAPNIVYAPARTEAKRTDKPIAVTLSNENQSDRMYITASEDAKSEYQIGCDLQKMFATNTPQAPMIYSVNYGGIKLAAEEAPIVNDKASYALSLYAPANGTYRIETPTESENADLYLTKDGRVIWNLSMNGYEVELTKGTTEGYGLLLVRKAPSVATGVDEPTSDSSLKGRATKVVIDEHVYILRDGQMYDVTGKAVK